MKNFLLVASLAIGAFGAAHAQILEKTKVSVQVGYDSRSYSFDQKATKGTYGIESKGYVRGGFALDVPMGRDNNWLFETGVYYTRQAFDYSSFEKNSSYHKSSLRPFETRGTTTTTRSNVVKEFRGHALELPVMFGYQHNVWELGLNLMLGGYVNYVVSGTCDTYAVTTSTSTGTSGFDYAKGKIEASEDYDSAAENLDAGIQAEFGVRWKRLYLGVAYQHGFCDLIKNNDKIESLRSSNVTVKAGFTF